MISLPNSGVIVCSIFLIADYAMPYEIYKSFMLFNKYTDSVVYYLCEL